MKLDQKLVGGFELLPEARWGWLGVGEDGSEFRRSRNDHRMLLVDWDDGCRDGLLLLAGERSGNERAVDADAHP